MKIHVVNKGDSLWKISQQYGVSTNRIVRINGLENPEKLVIGLALLIPEPYLQYRVQPGDTLGKIVTQFGTTLQEIMQTNRITNPSNIYPGQRLTIPVIFHTVRERDTLYDIARRYGTTVQSIMQTNRITDPISIYPGQIVKIPQKPKPTIDVNGFTNVYGQRGAVQVREVAYDLTYVSPFGYRMRQDGSLEVIDDNPTIQAAQSTGVVPMMCITNFSATEAGTRLAHTILSDLSLVEKLLTNVINTMKNKGYRGLNIDFESVAPADRDFYNRFLQRAVDRLRPEGYFVSSSLAPKTSANQKGLLVEAHDYPVHGRLLDFVVLMTYEWGYRKGPPQAISPIDQIKRVLDYAVTVIPTNKIFIGFQIYARDWLVPHKEGQEAETFDMQEAIRRATQYNVEIKYDETVQSPYYRYKDSQGRTHEVWFEDARSAKAKFDLVKSYRARGLSYWVLGYPFPQNWELLGDTFIVRKL
ncbi:spore gernimation protein [Peribacillus butanolivorans]|uniref:LysM peptidoglycan-binding domain-containing protein n=1 Tax=Peribacillus butanolivorans TaxID=421767 RepID=A0AAX0S7K7_9BACI|nr:LysM peptidoglycan-binding domain-containing protein [Peribacillus butanolivorans]AXN41906.1 LysM peptidoglycan-binding domain-containing protein [Peribacillus butanolivorans]PEJ36365.1 spore gernimation protein [Peribacillus butanolivorans]